MMDLPEFADESVENTKQQARNLISWLEDPYRCDSCGSYCYAEQDYVDRQAAIMPIWKCRGCGNRYHRDE